jgi:hypothetical protein
LDLRIARHRRAALVCAAVVLAAPVAHADVDFQVAAGAGVSWIRTMPTLTSDPVSTAAREVPAHDVPIGGSVGALGGSLDLSIITSDRWFIPMAGFGAYGAVGSYPTVLSSVDGSIARIRPWSTYEIDILLPGIGYRVIRRRFMFSASLRSGVSSLHVGGSIAGGNDTQPVSYSGFSPLIQAEIEACRRLDPVTRVCLQAAPRVYNFGIVNGATFGLRVEWGR